jgi:peptide/nickel transport system substrate-binding protein
MSPLWQAYVNDPVFYEAAERLFNYDFTSMEERADLFEICLPKSMEDNVHMFMVNDESFSPMRADVRVAEDLAGGLSGGSFSYYSAAPNSTFDSPLSGSWVWALTAHFVDDEGDPLVGGTMRVAMPKLLVKPWNPIAGTDSVYDLLPIRATGDQCLQPDTRTGLQWPGRIERAEVFVQTGIPIGVTSTDWCSLTFVPEIHVPLDAWADWDAAEQRFITVQEKYGSGGIITNRKSVSYYPEDIFEIPLHDGSTLSMGDFILYTILQFDRAKPNSAIYEESAIAAYDVLMSHFKGVKFVTDNPNYGLIVEYYSDYCPLDAELAVTTMFPFYPQGPGLWHTTALGIKAEEGSVLAFSEAKSSALGVEWMSFIDGSSLPILKGYLDIAKATNYIPYEPTMGLYVTEAEATERWSNLEAWYSDKGHFWVGSGPFYLQSADTAEKVVHLKRFEGYPDPSDRWLFLLEPLP